MKRILGNLRAYWQYLGGAFLLFLIQMYCICGIADSVYGLKNTGADSQGMEFALATALSDDAFGQVGIYMTAAELADQLSAGRGRTVPFEKIVSDAE